MTDKSKYICIDVGGTAIKHGVLDENKTFLKKGSTQTPPDGEVILESICNIVETYLQDNPAGGGETSLVGVCISSAGMVDPDEGSIFYSGPTIRNFVGTQYKKTIEERFYLPCEVENDVNCAGLAEYHAGTAAGHDCALILTIGTGVGGCAIIDGKVHHGATNSACEVGYMQFGDGVFQDMAATSSLIKEVKSAKGDQSSWGGKRIFAEAKNGDEICIKAIDKMCRVLGMGISNICFVLNPSVVVLGGGVMAQAEYLIPRISSVMESNLPPVIFKSTKLAAAHFKNDAGMIGAYYHFLEMRQKRS